MSTTDAQTQQAVALVRTQQQLAQAVEPMSGLDLMTLSTVMVQSGFFPDLKSVAQGVVKILAGRELGFPPIASLRHIYVHHGHIGLQAILVATRIRESGRYDYKVLRAEDEVCEIEFLRKVDDEWRSEGIASFNAEDAKRAGLVRDGGAYRTYPEDMMFARAMMRGYRRYCPDIFGQAIYAPEEIAEIARREPVADGTIGDAVANGDDLMPRRRAEAAPQAAEPEPAEPETKPAPPASVPVPTGPVSDAEALAAMLGEELPAPEAPPPPAPDDSAERGRWLGRIDKLVADRKVKAPIVGGFWEQHAPRGRDTATVEELRALHDALDTATAGAAPAPPRQTALSFTIGPKTYQTAGITKSQLLEAFKLSEQVNRKAGGSDLAKAVLVKEFGVASRTDLTQEQADRYLVRLRELLEG